MSETKSYKNLNKTQDFDFRARISCRAKKAAFLVPKLLAKMAEKLIVIPVTKLVTGKDYQDIKKEAVDKAMVEQKVEAEKLNQKIEEGQANLEEWRADTEYLVGNMAEYKAYQSTIERLEKRRTRLLTSPKKLLIGKAYLSVMKERREERKEQKQVRKMVQEVVNDYMLKKQSIRDKELEIEALENALKTARGELTSMNQDLQQFSADNAEIINQINSDEEYVEVAADETVVTPEEVSVESSQTENSPEEKVTFKIVDPDVAYPAADQATANDELTEQELNSVFAGVAGVVTPEEVSVEPQVEVPTTEEPSIEQPVEAPVVNETYSGKYLRKETVAEPQAATPNVSVTPVVEPVATAEQTENTGFDFPTVAGLDASDQEALFAEMAKLAGIGQTPVSDASTLESYGLSEEGSQKQM